MVKDSKTVKKKVIRKEVKAKAHDKSHAKVTTKSATPEKTDSKKVSSIDKPKPSKVAHGHLVSVEYVGTLNSGEEFDNSKNHGPIQFVVGNGQVIPGFDTAVIGMKVNDTKKFNIPKQDAYGDINPALVQIVPLSKIPEHIRSQLKAGGFLVMQAPTGQQVPVKVVKLDKENVHLDMNHPLAGQDLTFEIKLVDVNHAPVGDSCECGDDCGDDCGGSCDCGHEHK
jgi:peptidylprolyl isomerase